MSSPVILDTNTLIRLDQGRALGREARRLIDLALAREELLVAAISFWEIGVLLEHGRVELPLPLRLWRATIIENGLREVPLTGDIAIFAAALNGLPRDPADRIIVATAEQRGATLVTADSVILSWRSPLPRHDASK